jgi:transcriptional regulator of arginine metabolism
MEKKYNRLSYIKQVIQEEAIPSQEELLEKLRGQGFELTQATLSRDLKRLKVYKAPGPDGSYRYVLPSHAESKGADSSGQESHSLEGFLSLEFSGRMGVIRTVPAYSHTIASAIDQTAFQSIAGTVAGNDTIIFVIREGHSPHQVREELLEAFPGITGKII